MKIVNCIIIVFLILIVSLSCNQNGLFNPSDNLEGVSKFEFYIDEESYLDLLANKTQNYEVSTRYFFEGDVFLGKIRAAGAGSRYFPKWSYRVEMDNDDENIKGYNEFNLSAQVHDPTMLHTTVVSELYKQAGFLTFDNFHVFVKINNNDKGLYQFIEIIEDDFFEIRGLQAYELYKGAFNSKFTFEDGYDPRFHFKKEFPENNDFTYLFDLIRAIDTCSNERVISSLGKFLDLDNYIKYHALTTLVNNSDAFENNFYIMKKTPQAPYQFIPWDFDRCFERNSNIGLYGKNDIIKKLFRNDSTFNLYKSELYFMLDSIFTTENVSMVIDAHKDQIRQAYNLDPYLGGGRYDFDQEIQDLKDYVANRRQYFHDNLPNFTRPDLD